MSDILEGQRMETERLTDRPTTDAVYESRSEEKVALKDHGLVAGSTQGESPRTAPIAPTNESRHEAAKPNQPSWISSVTTSNYDDATLLAKDRLSYIAAAVMVLGPLLMGAFAVRF